MFSRKLKNLLSSNRLIRQIHRDGNAKVARTEKLSLSQSLKNRLMAPAGPTAFIIGQRALIGASTFGFGYLCYYGLGTKKDILTLNKSIIIDTYKHVGSSLAICVASSIAVFQISSLLKVSAKLNWISISTIIVLFTGSSLAAKLLPYESGFHPKQLAWVSYCFMMGVLLSPLKFVGSRILIQAASYAGVVIGGLTTVAVCAPNHPFQPIHKPLLYAQGIVLIASVASMMLPPTTIIGAAVFSLTVYGGLFVFSGLLICDTQCIIYQAGGFPPLESQQFDPIFRAILIYMSMLNIYVRSMRLLLRKATKGK